MDDTFKSITLMKEVATKDTVEKLYEKGFITQEGKDYALEFLEPHQEWGHWTAQIIHSVGWLLILSGMLYLLIVNWPMLSTFHKFASIEISLFCCLLGTWTYTLDSLKGKILLTAACVFVGIFVLVFNQIYPTLITLPQQLSMTLALTLPWIMISKFKYAWGLWLVCFMSTLILFIHPIHL